MRTTSLPHLRRGVHRCAFVALAAACVLPRAVEAAPAAAAAQPVRPAAASSDPDARLLASAAFSVFHPPAPVARPIDGPAPAPARRSHRHLGLQLDGGAPDLAGAGLVYRPRSWLRVTGSALHSTAGFGARGGVTLAPAWIVAPSLTVEGGRHLEANLSSAVARFARVSPEVDPMLRRFGYTFASAQVGLEIGHPNAFVLFVRAGLSRVWTTVHGAEAAAGSALDDGDTVVTALDDPRVRLGIPSAKVGLVFYVH
jgi:hypothetical protein